MKSHYILLSLLFFAGLEMIGWFHRWIIVLLFILLALIIYGIILLRIEERESKHLSQFVLPVLSAIGFISFSLFLPSTNSIHVYYALSALAFYWLLNNGAKRAYPTWNWTLSTAVLLVLVAAALGLRWHLFAPVLLVMSLTALSIFLLSLQAWLQQIDRSKAFILSLAMTLILTELIWVLIFLPWHFLVLAGIIVTIYYVAFQLISLSLSRSLQNRDVAEYAVVGGASLLLLILIGTWT